LLLMSKKTEPPGDKRDAMVLAGLSRRANVRRVAFFPPETMVAESQPVTYISCSLLFV
jgi:hypothetical protein